MTHQEMLGQYAQAKEKALGMGGPGKLAKRKAILMLESAAMCCLIAAARRKAVSSRPRIARGCATVRQATESSPVAANRQC